MKKSVKFDVKVEKMSNFDVCLSKSRAKKRVRNRKKVKILTVSGQFWSKKWILVEKQGKREKSTKTDLRTPQRGVTPPKPPKTGCFNPPNQENRVSIA